MLDLRHPLSSWGALTTIVMLVIDSFAQQVIRYYNCSVPADGEEVSVRQT